MGHSALKLQKRQLSTQQPEPSKPKDLRSQFNSKPIIPGPYFQDPPSDILGTNSQITPKPIPGPYFQPLPNTKPKRSVRPYIYALLFFLLGQTAGDLSGTFAILPPQPLPGTPADENQIAAITKLAENLPLVQSLSSDPNWTWHDAYHGFPAEEKPHRLTTGPLGGSRGIGGFQRIFQNAETGESISVIFIGAAVSGWPRVAHGGLTATIMDESLGRAAIMRLVGKTGVTANLELKYLRPIKTLQFYVIRTVAVPEGATENKQWISGRLEALDGTVCIEAKALFVVPKQFTTKRIEGL